MPSVSSLEEAADALRAASADGRTVRIGADLDPSGMARVLEHEAGDLTCTVEAGIRMSALRPPSRVSGSGCRSTLRAIRPSAPASPPISRDHSATASAHRAISSSA